MYKMKTNTKAIVIYKHVYISSIHSIFDVGYACNHTKYYLKKNKLGDNGTFLLNEIAEKNHFFNNDAHPKQSHERNLVAIR